MGELRHCSSPQRSLFVLLRALCAFVVRSCSYGTTGTRTVGYVIPSCSKYVPYFFGS